MKKKYLTGLVAGLLIFCSSNAMALVLTENFDTDFPAWETGWLGTNSNLQNYFGVGGGRGGNPDGLWISDGDAVMYDDTAVEIVFDKPFGEFIANFTIDISTYVDGIFLQVFDFSGVSIFNSPVTRTNGAMQNPGIYDNFTINSSNGISAFSLLTTGGNQIEGETGIDNVSVTIIGSSAVPEPATMLLFGICFIGFASSRLRPVRK